ncbi:hypothetical protein BD410DRAFT_757791 [Rickenella mellea]|uniref:JmjC domain-containing protein n=1 Tax=Rickenella mellea TaxID=50990 RepID=A0A4R5XDL5_9AGAM|nr:hypothetical protein BD410DRAFT_757791 [Rickenella mellea]
MPAADVRKTSITQLLNPVIEPPKPTPSSHSLPQFDQLPYSRPKSPPRIIGGHHRQEQYQHQRQSPPSVRPPSPPQFGLRAASWDASTDYDRPQDDDYETRGPSYSGQVTNRTARAWQPPAVPQPLTYEHHNASTMMQNERAALSGNHFGFPSSQPPPLFQMVYAGPHAEFQTSERVSTRLAVRAITDKPVEPGRTAQQRVAPFPPSPLEPGVSGQLDFGTSRKRIRKSEEAEGESSTAPGGDAGSVKPKKIRTKPKITFTPSNGTWTKAKKNYPARKRNEGTTQLRTSTTEKAIVDGKEVALSFIRDPTTSLETVLKPGVVFAELQFARCMSNRYKSDEFPRCVSCTRRWAGDTCRFQGIRFLIRDDKRQLIGVSFATDQVAESPAMALPAKWNVDLQPHHYDRVMGTVAKSLLPHLLTEKNHSGGDVIRRPRETDVRATCDTCMTSLFSNSWMCRQCGREACADCFKTVVDVTASLPVLSPTERAARQMRRDKHAQTNPFFLSCTRRHEHQWSFFSRVSRFCDTELDDAIEEMTKLLERIGSLEEVTRRHGQPTAPIDDMAIGTMAAPSSAPAGNSVDTAAESSTNGALVTSGLATRQSKDKIPDVPSVGFILENTTPPGAPPPTTPIVPSWPITYFKDSDLTEEIFRTAWMRGEPVVVTGLGDKFNINWTPEFFMGKYSSQSCLIIETQKDANKRITVGEFFSWFGKYEDRTDEWKLKDWPPSSDFKTAFPELFEDFIRAVPAPTYTRKDGAMNIASHFPTNAIAPDLGPKMYNAFASTEAPGSKGSTRLHMDMADAVNIMLHSEKCANGNPGCAAWDVFRAEDSSTIRKFLRKLFKGTYHNDPIHAQMFYLDSDLRQKLYDEFGVKSWRIYQQPGEAVFIPAGCAHQVANLADCIKVACDFVSPENIERCEMLTQEFRDQNQSLVWKEDVLQLRTMLWFAWLSCRRNQKEKEQREEQERKETSVG